MVRGAGTVVLLMLLVRVATAEEASIAGIVTTVDAAAGTLVGESVSRGKTRAVTIRQQPNPQVHWRAPGAHLSVTTTISGEPSSLR